MFPWSPPRTAPDTAARGWSPHPSPHRFRPISAPHCLAANGGEGSAPAPTLSGTDTPSCRTAPAGPARSDPFAHSTSGTGSPSHPCSDPSRPPAHQSPAPCDPWPTPRSPGCRTSARSYPGSGSESPYSPPTARPPEPLPPPHARPPRQGHQTSLDIRKCSPCSTWNLTAAPRTSRPRTATGSE